MTEVPEKMNIKLVLGTLLPLTLILCLVLLSVVGGVSVEEQTIDSIPFSSIIYHDLYYSPPRSYIPVETITITNDFLLPKKYRPPAIIACLYDKEGLIEPHELPVKFEYKGRFHRFSPGFGVAMIDSIFFSRLHTPYNYYLDIRQGTDVPAKSQGQVEVLIEPLEVSNPSGYRNYDELLLTKEPLDRCRDLENEELDSATHIPLSK